MQVLLLKLHFYILDVDVILDDVHFSIKLYPNSLYLNITRKHDICYFYCLLVSVHKSFSSIDMCCMFSFFIII